MVCCAFTRPPCSYLVPCLSSLPWPALLLFLALPFFPSLGVPFLPPLVFPFFLPWSAFPPSLSSFSFSFLLPSFALSFSAFCLALLPLFPRAVCCYHRAMHLAEIAQVLPPTDVRVSHTKRVHGRGYKKAQRFAIPFSLCATGVGVVLLSARWTQRVDVVSQ